MLLTKMNNNIFKIQRHFVVYNVSSVNPGENLEPSRIKHPCTFYAIISLKILKGLHEDPFM